MSDFEINAQTIVTKLKYRRDLGLLFDSSVGRYHRLRNSTAKHIIDGLFQGHQAEQVVTDIATHYNIESSRARADMQDLCSELARNIGVAELPHQGDSLVEIDKRFAHIIEFPLRIELELTAVCNWNCGFCYNVWKIDPNMSDAETRLAVRSLPTKHLPIASAKRILDECAANGCFVVRYSGGETLIHPDALEIFEYGGSLGLYQVVFTNGHFVNHDIAKRMSKANVRCALVSLHGDRAQHNSLAGHKFAYDRAINAMRVLLAEGIQVVAELTLVAENTDSLLDVIRDVYNIGVREFGVMRYVPTGKNDEHYGVPVDVTMPMIERVNALTRDECIGMRVAWPCAQKLCTSDKDTPLRSDDPTLALRLSQLVGHCESGIVWASVSYDGQLRNCPHSNVYFGHVGAEFGDVSNSWPRLTNAVHKAVASRPSCDGCSAAEVCRGGCHLGSFFSQNPVSVSLGLPQMPD